jgi:hypothetical protein
MEHKYVYDYVQSVSHIVNNYPPKVALRTLHDKLIQKFTSRTYNIIQSTAHTEIINLHEVQKRMLGQDMFNDVQETPEITLTQQNNGTKHYLFFDSRNRDLSTAGTQNLQWRYVHTTQLEQGVVCSAEKISNIVSMRIYQPVMPASVVNPNTGRVAIHIEEFVQSVIGTRRYHFLTKVNTNLINSTFVECQTEEFSDGIYNFNVPITSLDTMTFTFSDPSTLITFNPDRSNATISFTNPVQMTCVIPHNLSVGDRIFIEEFRLPTPANPSEATAIAGFRATNTLINPLGFSVSNVVSPTVFEIAVDTSGVVHPPSLTIVVYFGNTRVVFAMEMTCVKN